MLVCVLSNSQQKYLVSFTTFKKSDQIYPPTDPPHNVIISSSKASQNFVFERQNPKPIGDGANIPRITQKFK